MCAQFDVDQMKFGLKLTKVNSNGKSHRTTVTLKFHKDTQQFSVVWESESFWKSSADCQSTCACTCPGLFLCRHMDTALMSPSSSHTTVYV